MGDADQTDGNEESGCEIKGDIIGEIDNNGKVTGKVTSEIDRETCALLGAAEGEVKGTVIGKDAHGNDTSCPITGKVDVHVDAAGNVTGAIEANTKDPNACKIVGSITGDFKGNIDGNIDIAGTHMLSAKIEQLCFVYARLLPFGQLLVDTITSDKKDYREINICLPDAKRALFWLRLKNFWLFWLIRSSIMQAWSFLVWLVESIITLRFAPIPEQLPSQFDLEFTKPSRVIFYFDSNHWDFAEKGFRFVSEKEPPKNPLGGEPSEKYNDTFNHLNMVTIDDDGRKAVTIVNHVRNAPERRNYAFELIVDAKYQNEEEDRFSTRVIIDPGVGNDGG